MPKEVYLKISMLIQTEASNTVSTKFIVYSEGFQAFSKCLFCALGNTGIKKKNLSLESCEIKDIQ